MVVALVLELLLYLGIKFAGKSQEYLSGYATGVEHHEAWTERVETAPANNANTKLDPNSCCTPDWLSSVFLFNPQLLHL